MSYLEHISTPEDLRKLSVEQLPALCEELRHFIINQTAQHPGHLGSSLGVVELTVAIHYVFDTPHDKLIWDVGHQAYAHKILTGRRERFNTNRQFKGLAPFPTPKESEYDAFVAGHASNSISAALGMEVADELQGIRRNVVAIIGDGAMTGGLAFEGLNNASSADNDLLIILNDNNMSISGSVGGMRTYLTHLQTSRSYNTFRYYTAKVLSKLGLLDDRRRRDIIRKNNRLKMKLTNQQNIFEGMDIRYFGPIDGHNVLQLVRVLKNIRNMHGPRLLHIHTVKGKGFRPAEMEADIWHAPGLFDKKTGERLVKSVKGQPPLFQDVFGETLLELMRSNSNIVGITPAMPLGCSLNIPMKEFPDRCFDVGIAEGHAVTFSGGLAKEGLTPFCNIYSSFAQRAYDNIIHDVAIQKLNVVFCLDRAGIVGEDGPTHHGAFDLAFLRPIPGLTIASPFNEHELRRLMYTAQMPGSGPFVIRYPRGRGVLTDWRCPLEPVRIGTGQVIKSGKDLAILSIGPIGNIALNAIKEFEDLYPMYSIALYDMRFLKPIDTAILHGVGTEFDRIITLENGCVTGGLGSAVAEYMSDNNLHPELRRIGLPDEFIQHGTIPQLLEICGMDSEAILKAMADMLVSPKRQDDENNNSRSR